MIQQTVLPFKVEKTDDTITPHSGLALLGEFVKGTKVLETIDAHLPEPGSSVGYKPSEYIFSVILMLNGGGRSLEDMRVIRQDEGLRETLGLKAIPSSDALGNWLRKRGDEGGLEAVRRGINGLLELGMRDEDIKEYTLDIDATGIEAEKELAKMTYKGYKGYMPIVGHLAENGLVIGDEFREGNVSPATRNLEFIKYCIAQMPKGKTIKYLRADSAAYQGSIINFCEAEGIQFAIGADLDKAVVKVIKNIPKEDWRPYSNGSYIAETVHSMNNTKKAFRLLIIRRPYQMNLFNKEEDISVKYVARATNMEGEAEDIIKWYNKRGEHSENRIKDLKIGFGMERMPCGQSEANALFFRIGVLSYNFFKLFAINTLDRSWHNCQVETIRWRLYQIAGKIVYHANQIFLKVHRRFYNLFENIRLRTWEFCKT